MRCFQHSGDLSAAYVRYLCHAGYDVNHVNLVKVSYSYTLLQGNRYAFNRNLKPVDIQEFWEIKVFRGAITFHFAYACSYKSPLGSICKGNSHIHLHLGYSPVKLSDSNLTTPLRFSASAGNDSWSTFLFSLHFLCDRGARLARLQNEILEEPIFCTFTCISHSEL